VSPVSFHLATGLCGQRSEVLLPSFINLFTSKRTETGA
jgi:hypothetical protein